MFITCKTMQASSLAISKYVSLIDCLIQKLEMFQHDFHFSLQSIATMVDIVTYRLRIGSFAGGTKLRSKFNKRKKTTMVWTSCGFTRESAVYTGLVTMLIIIIQIRVHLLLSGDVELNPGPGTQEQLNTETNNTQTATTQGY